MGVLSWANRCWAIVVAISVAVVSLVAATVAAADDTEVENFRYASWDLDYDLSLDAQGRAQAEVTERLAAEFPNYDQNRGIIRSLPLRYQGAPAAPENIRVTDGAGNDVPFEVENEDGFRNILVGDDRFVHGAQTYEIHYTVADVMHATDGPDEFYWDLVPVDRQQDIGTVSAEVNLDSTLSSALTGSSACYRGTPDNSQACTVQTTGSDPAVFRVSESSLPAGQGLTVAIGVDAGTVTQPPERQDNFLLDVVPVLLAGAATLLAAGGAISAMAMVRRYRNDTSLASTDIGIPQGMNPLMAKWVTGHNHNPVVATILDLAVRGVVRIEEDVEEPSRGKNKTKPMLRLLNPQIVQDPLELQLLEGIFPDLAPGAVFAFPKNSKSFTKASQTAVQSSGQAVLDRGYQQKVRHRGSTVTGWISLVLLIPVIVLLIMGASRDNTVTVVITIILGIICLMLSFGTVVKHRVLTPTGAAARRQMETMHHLMQTSEAERLNMMQSYTNAARQSLSDQTTDGTVLQLYDRLLPYAVLFGMQKEWAGVLAHAYQMHQVPPYWYPAMMHSGSSSLQDSLTTMLNSVSSAAATSSPSSGSTGGGAAGGGGGGGAAGGR